MRHDDTMRMKDGISLAYTRFEVPKPRAIVCVLHGLGEYMARHNNMARMMNEHGISVRGLDYRGHGRSPGKRGSATYKRLVSDAGEMLMQAQSEDLPIFLFGHSLGGGLALHLLMTSRLPLCGAIVTSPWLLLKKPLTPSLRAALQVLGRVAPTMTKSNGLDALDLCHDQACNHAYQQDPLVHDKISFSIALGASKAAEHSLAHAKELTVPLLLMHGTDDPICDVKGSRAFAEKAGTMCSYFEYPSMYHELHNESIQEDLFQREMDFMDARLMEMKHKV